MYIKEGDHASNHMTGGLCLCKLWQISKPIRKPISARAAAGCSVQIAEESGRPEVPWPNKAGSAHLACDTLARPAYSFLLQTAKQ